MLLSCLAQAHQLPFALAHITAEGHISKTSSCMKCILCLLVDALNLGFPFFCDACVVVCEEVACNDRQDIFRRGRCPLTPHGRWRRIRCLMQQQQSAYLQALLVSVVVSGAWSPNIEPVYSHLSLCLLRHCIIVFRVFGKPSALCYKPGIRDFHVESRVRRMAWA